VIEPSDYTEGDRVRAVNFVLDEGLRIWPAFDEKQQHQYRVVRVADQEVKETLMYGESHRCQQEHPDATFGINDNESVPPGTEGTVDHVTRTQVGVRWDNGRRLFCAPADTIEKL
jgi:hypothetical protein